MRKLLYYNLNSQFEADQAQYGGDGSNVVSTRSGVAYAADTWDTYYNPHDETVLKARVIINYVSAGGKTIFPSKVITVDYFSGKSSKLVLTPKDAGFFSPVNEIVTANISGNTTIDIIYKRTKIDPELQLMPLTFEIIEPGNIIWKATNSPARTIEYKKNTGDWISITSTSAGTQISVSAGDIVQFRGNNTSYAGYGYSNYFGGTCTFNIKGNIMSLINKTEFSELDTLVSDYAFRELFWGNGGLVSAEDLVLPATTLAGYCYFSMFDDCTSLTSAPAILPATTLANYCYQYMFQGCTSLTTAPVLPATTLTQSCYLDMFNGCTSLISAPELPATTLANSCYNSMFGGCTSLTSAPELPATTLANGCYQSMFQGCTSLTTAPELPATTLAPGCYYNMFSKCTSLTSAPALPVTTLADNCYDGMFWDCTSLTSTPELPATTLADWCYNNMFRGCTSLTTAPELPATTLASNCYGCMFSGCTSLTTAPELPATTLAGSCYQHMFRGCTSLTTAPELPATILASYCYRYMFNGCTNLNYIKCLATNISASDCTLNWVRDVASTGTFVKNANMSSWTTGNNGIPAGWTIQDAAI